MRITEEAVLETLRRIQRFLDDKGDLLAVVNQSGARKRLDQISEQMAAHAVAQLGWRRTARGETQRQRALRTTLRYDLMQPIAIVAGQHLREKQEFKLLRLPRWKARGAELIAAARGMATAAEKHMDLFVEEGLAPDFADRVRATADRVEESIGTRAQGWGQQAGATAGLKADTKRARARIRLLDSMVRPALGTNDPLLREWQVAKHIQRARTPVSATPAAEPALAAAPSLVLTSAVV